MNDTSFSACFRGLLVKFQHIFNVIRNRFHSTFVEIIELDNMNHGDTSKSASMVKQSVTASLLCSTRTISAKIITALTWCRIIVFELI